MFGLGCTSDRLYRNVLSCRFDSTAILAAIDVSRCVTRTLVKVGGRRTTKSGRRC